METERSIEIVRLNRFSDAKHRIETEIPIKYYQIYQEILFHNNTTLFKLQDIPNVYLFQSKKKMNKTELLQKTV